MKSWWELGEWIGHDGETLSTYRIECPFCGEEGHFSTEFHSEKKKPNSRKVLNFDTLKCTNCAGYVMVLWSASEMGGSRGLHDYRVLPWPLKVSQAPEHWPPAVQRSWVQAHRSFEGENWDAAAVMARTAMQSALVDKQAQGNRLVDQIDNLANQGTLPPLMKDWAHEVRLLGNEGTHTDPQDTGVEEEDASDVIEFLDYLLEYLYNLPKQIEDYRTRGNRSQTP